MKRIFLALSLVLFVGIAQLYSEQNYLKYMVTSVYWSVRHNAWVVKCQTPQNKTEYIYLGERNPEDAGNKKTEIKTAEKEDKPVLQEKEEPVLPAPTISFSYSVLSYDPEENKTEIRLSHNTNRSDLIQPNDLTWKVNEEARTETVMLIDTGVAYNVEVSHEGLGISSERDINASKPYMYSFRHFPGDYNDQNQCAVSFQAPSFSGNVINLDKGEFKLTDKKSDRVLECNGDAYYFSPGRHDIISEYFNSRGELISSRTDSITINNPPLKVDFEASLQGNFPPSVSHEWKTTLKGAGITTITAPVSDALRGTVEAETEINMKAVSMKLSGTMKSENFTAEIIQADLKGNVNFNEDTSILRCTASGDIYLKLGGTKGGISLEGKTVKINITQNLAFEVVNGKNGHELEEVIIGLKGAGNEFTGKLPSPPVVNHTPEKTEAASGNSSAGASVKISKAKQPPKPQESKPSSIIKIIWRNNEVELKNINNANDQWLFIHYNTADYTVAKVILHYHKPSVTYIFPGQASIINRKITEQISSQVLEIKK